CRVIIAAARGSLARTKVVVADPLKLTGHPIGLSKSTPALVDEQDPPLGIDQRQLIFRRVEYRTIKIIAQVGCGKTIFSESSVHQRLRKPLSALGNWRSFTCACRHGQATH